MKTFINITSRLFLVSCALALCTACEKDLDTYEGDNGIYFDPTGMQLDTIYVHWGLKNSDVTSQTVNMTVNLIGNTASYDRAFSIEVSWENDSTGAAEGVEFEKLPVDYVIPAGEARCVFPVKLLRSADLVRNSKIFTMRLVPNDQLRFIYSRQFAWQDTTGVINTRLLDYQRVIKMDERFPIPAWWDLDGQPNFGVWTMKKAALICDVMGIDRERWIDASINRLSSGYLRFCGRYMYRWLKEHPQTEEDGSPMEMGPDAVN